MRAFRFTFLFLAMTSSLVQAENTVQQTREVNADLLELEAKAVAIKNAEQEKQEASTAEAWGLSLDEYKLYQSLMRGPRGVWSAEADPLMVLGVEAKTEQEQRKYARLLLKMQGEREKREIAFTAIVIEEQEKMMRVQPASAFAEQSSGVLTQLPARYVFFASVKEACDVCKAQLASAITKAIKQSVVLDVFLLDTHGSDEAVRSWAKSMGLPADYVKQGQLTLNHDGGSFEKLTHQSTATWPVLFSRSMSGGFTRL